MSETKTYVFGEGGNSQNGFDPNLIWASMMNGGGFGGGMNYLWPFFLLFLWGRGGFGGWGNNGNGCGNGYEFLSSQINNSTGRELLMQAINGNGNAIGQLANNFNCGIGDIQNALHSLSTQICQFSAQTGLGQQQVINALERGDASLASQLASCCCDLKGAISGVEATVTRGFADVGYALRDQTCNLERVIAASTERIVEGQRAAEMRELQRELATLRDEKQTCKIGGMIAAATNPILAEVEGIKCKLPRTVTLPYAEAQAVPNCIGWGLGLNGWGFNNNGFV
ncbi:MAG: hypothetical protein J6V05_01200 [Alistipes sp.]|nr:hypothetical protein [Alistipes sp.]